MVQEKYGVRLATPEFNWQRSAFVLSCFSGWESGGLLESKEDANDKNR